MGVQADLKINESEVISREQYVTFVINNETYGIEVLRVKEIVGMTTIISVPNSEKYLKGVMNLRGTVVPVIDLRMKFNIPEKDHDFFTVILIIEMKDFLVGVIVDSVSDVITSPGPLCDVPNFNVSINRDVIKGVFNKDGDLIIILNADIMLTIRDLEILAELKEA